jgi:hypothetical protein
MSHVDRLSRRYQVSGMPLLAYEKVVLLCVVETEPFLLYSVHSTGPSLLNLS